MKYINYLFVLAIFSIGISSCTDVIDVDLEKGESQLVVDAWINNQAEPQVIRLRTTSPYFDTSASPSVTGAQVSVTDEDGNVFDFIDTNSNGNYIWDPQGGTPFGTVGKSYTLNIESNGITYQSTSQMGRIVPVDSITQEFREPELGSPEGIYAQFFGRDLVGLDDCYWIKTFKNGQFLNKPLEINIAYDGGFSAGSEVDGLIFIPPIRETVNRVPDDGDDAVDDSDTPPWMPGDSIYVEIHSITVAAFDFLDQARTQMTLGDAGIFAEPLANVPTNIKNVNDPNDNSAIGFFCVSAVSSLGKRIE